MGFIFNSLGAGEILLALVVGLLFFGAKRLPDIARTLGQAINKMRRAANDFSSEIMNKDSFMHFDQDSSEQHRRPGVEEKKEKDKV